MFSYFVQFKAFRVVKFNFSIQPGRMLLENQEVAFDQTFHRELRGNNISLQRQEEPGYHRSIRRPLGRQGPPLKGCLYLAWQGGQDTQKRMLCRTWPVDVL